MSRGLSLKQSPPIVHADTAIKEIRKSDMPEPIEGGAYRKLRDARSEARNIGKREKRAKDKADEDAAAKKKWHGLLKGLCFYAGCDGWLKVTIVAF